MQFKPMYFITTVFITMFILYIMYPEPDIIIKYPSPKEAVSDVYIDDNDVCYKYHRQEYVNIE